MASALLASRHEPSWGEHKVYARSNDAYPNPNNPKNCSNPNPSYNPNLHQIADDHASDNNQGVESDDRPGPSGAAASGDSSSLHRRPAEFGDQGEYGGYVSFNISACSRQEIRDLRKRLTMELDQVRGLRSRIEAKELQSSARSAAYSASNAHAGGREAGSEALANRSAPVAAHPPEIKKRPAGSGAMPELVKLHTAMMKRCSQILTRLMKHKGAIWFNVPVDVVGMGLYDYHQIVKKPMDLGTVKSKLTKGSYTHPSEFGEDVRLTFSNALLYNSPEHEVSKFAQLLLKQFEGSFGPACAKHEMQRATIISRAEEDRQRALSRSRALPLPENLMRAELTPVFSPPPVQTPRLQPPPPVQPQPKQKQQQPAMKMVKHLQKPKANGAIRRAMSMEERTRLSTAMQDLQPEQANEVVHIVHQRCPASLNGDGDEVEIDFTTIDDETLWELDRFVSNWNKMMMMMMKSKRRQENMECGSNFQDPSAAPPPPADLGNKSPAPEPHPSKKMKKGDPVEEDVDIGDEMPATHYPSVEIEKEESSSSSSSSGSSSSSDSDSGGSSGSDSDDSDDDRPRSPAAVGSRDRQ